MELAGINTQMPRHVVNAVASILAQDAKDLDGSSVLVFGVAYKKMWATCEKPQRLQSSKICKSVVPGAVPRPVGAEFSQDATP